MIETLSLDDPSEQPQSFDHILLSDNIALLHRNLAIFPTGILLIGSDTATSRTIVQSAVPDVTFLSCYDHMVAKDRPLTLQKPGVVCIEDVDFGDNVEGIAKGIFMREDIRTLIGLASSQSNVPKSLLRANRFEKIQHFLLPTPDVRQKAWHAVLNAILSWHPQFKFPPREAALQLSMISPGYALSDFNQILYEAISRTVSDTLYSTYDASVLTFPMLKAIVAAHEPMKGSMDLDFVSNSTYRLDTAEQKQDHWGGHAGYLDVKATMVQLCEWPVAHSETFRRLGVDAPRGLLLHGPHGCGKTMLAMAFLQRLHHANWLHVNAPDLFSKYLGDSEARVRSLFERARQLTPCVVFIDDVDVVGGIRERQDDGGGSGVERRVLGSLLTELDGVNSGNVFVLACASSIEKLDPALVRPGRLDRILEIGHPSADNRRMILRELLLEVPLEKGSNADEGRNRIIENIVRSSGGMTGADLAALCREAGMIAMEESDEPEYVKESHFKQAILQIKCRATE